MSDQARWPAVLDAYEAALQIFSDLSYEDELPDLPDFVPPAGLGPLPAEHEERAQSLLRRSRELEASVLHGKEQSARHLALVGRTRTDRPTSTYVDHRA